MLTDKLEITCVEIDTQMAQVSRLGKTMWTTGMNHWNPSTMSLDGTMMGWTDPNGRLYLVAFVS